MHWIAQDYQWIFSGIGVLVASLLINLWRKSSPEASKKTESHLSVNSPSAIGSHNNQTVNSPIIHAENVHFGPAATPTRFTAPPHARTVERPNIEYIGHLQKPVYVGRSAREGLCDPHGVEELEGSTDALVFQFEQNTPDHFHFQECNCKAAVSTEDGAHSRSISYGIWLKTRRATVHISELGTLKN